MIRKPLAEELLLPAMLTLALLATYAAAGTVGVVVFTIGFVVFGLLLFPPWI